jgi:cell division protein FtsL
MSKFFALTKIKREFKRTSKLVQFTFNIKFLNIVVICLILLTSIFYIWEVNSEATKGFKVKDFEQKIEQSKKIGEKLELQIAELQSLGVVQEKMKSLNLEMVSVAKVDYLSPSNLAVRK